MLLRHLIVVRHARAASATLGHSDFDRPLSDEGRQEAERMGTVLIREGVPVDAVVASPARRAFDTARLLTAAREPAVPVWPEARLYEASVRTLSEIVHAFDDGWRTAWLVGHNPGVSHFAGWLFGEPTVADLPTCGVVWIELAVPHWNHLKPRCATLRARWS